MQAAFEFFAYHTNKSSTYRRLKSAWLKDVDSSPYDTRSAVSFNPVDAQCKSFLKFYGRHIEKRLLPLRWWALKKQKRCITDWFARACRISSWMFFIQYELQSGEKLLLKAVSCEPISLGIGLNIKRLENVWKVAETGDRSGQR